MPKRKCTAGYKRQHNLYILKIAVMKRTHIIIGLILIVSVLLAFIFGLTIRKDGTESNIRKLNIIEEYDTHGGLHGDGLLYIKADCGNEPEQIEKITESWSNFPIPEEIEVLLSGGTVESGSFYGGVLENDAILKPNSGKYYFENRADGEENSDYVNILKSYSKNFSVGIYDAERQLLYWIEYDS